MKVKYLVIFVFAMSFMTCKKDRVCECKNANGVYKAGDIKATKSGAKKYCKSLSTSATECYLK